jgi:fatty-acyl-CoA synthase
MTNYGIGSWPRRRARMHPAALAIVQGTRRVTYAELARSADALATTLAGLGVEQGDRVAYLGPNDIATFETLFAATRLGAIFVALNARLTGPEIAYLLGDCTPKVLVLAPELGGTADAAMSLCSIKPHIIHLHAGVRGGQHESAPWYRPAEPPPEAEVSLADPAIILYTSGTTGKPKGAVLTHGNITWNTVNQFAHFTISSHDVVLCSAPLYHVLGLGQITLPALYAGGTVVVVPKFDPGEFLATIEAERVTAFPLAPTMLQMLCEHPAWETADLSSVTCVVYGGSAISERVAKSWLSRRINILQGYGMTEASPGIFMALQYGALDHPVSAGVPHFFTDIKLLTAEGNVIDSPGQGELLVQGPNVFSGYWNQPEATQQSFIDGWFRTGDIIRIDSDGWAHIVGRVKDLIISGGENIYPAEVEGALGELDEVSSSAVIAVPDERWGEVGAAYIVLADGRDLDEARVRAHLDRRLARYKVPKYFTFVKELPRNSTGKIIRQQLRDRALQAHYARPAHR